MSFRLISEDGETRGGPFRAYALAAEFNKICQATNTAIKHVCYRLGRCGFFLLWWIAGSSAVLWIYVFLSNWSDDLNDVPLVHAKAREMSRHGRAVSASFGAPSLKKYRIALCAKVADESPYLLEWIEWHRQQGVDKFALYNPSIPGDPAAVDGRIVEAYQALYAQIGQSDLIDVYPALELHPDTNGGLANGKWITPMQAHRVHQHLMISHCVERYKFEADWILHMDPDEFLYSTVSPNSTLWSFLSGDTISQSMTLGLEHLLDPTRVVGYVFEARQMGMGGRLFDSHTTLSLDTVSGKVEVYFDPRDSLRYRQATRKQTELGKDEISALVRSLINPESEAAETKMQEVMNAATQKIQDYSDHELLLGSLREQLLAFDAIKELKSLADKEVDQLLEKWRDAFKHLYTSQSDMDVLASEEVFFVGDSAAETRLKGLHDDLRRQAQKARARAMGDSVLNLVGDSDLGLYLNDTARLRIMNEISTLWRPYFPLLSAEQVTTAPTGSEWQGLLPHIWSILFPRRCASGDMCTIEPLPSWMTTLGKAIYRTASMERSRSSRTRSMLRGCLRPWVHTCAHDIAEGRMMTVGAKNGIRLDHHQFRSLERRTTRLPAWRGSATGYADKPDFEAVLRYLSLQPATEKQALSEKVRDLIFTQFRPIAKHFDYSVVHNKDTDVIRALPSNIRSSCSPTELTSEIQVPCPRSHPYVGKRFVGLADVHYFLPDQYCSDAQDPTDALVDPAFWQESLVQQQNWTAVEAKGHLRLCPGWPEARCCDSLLNVTQSLWNTDLSVLVSSKYGVWQSALLPD